jgi:hypothetical protein
VAHRRIPSGHPVLVPVRDGHIFGCENAFLPTPFAIRTALLDAAIRTKGLVAGQATFAWIKELSIAVRPPERVVVTNLFAKILKPTRKEEPRRPWIVPSPFGSTPNWKGQ